MKVWYEFTKALIADIRLARARKKMRKKLRHKKVIDLDEYRKAGMR